MTILITLLNLERAVNTNRIPVHIRNVNSSKVGLMLFMLRCCAIATQFQVSTYSSLFVVICICDKLSHYDNSDIEADI